MKDLMDEAYEIAPSDKKIVLNGAVLLLGFLPYIGNATSLARYLKEVNSFQSFQNTNLAFIMKYTK